MPKIIKPFTAVQVSRLSHDVISNESRTNNKRRGGFCTAYHSVGNPAGLLLQCRAPHKNAAFGSRSWLLRTMIAGRRREIGLGSYPEVSLAQAREEAKSLKREIREEGIDPVAKRIELRSKLIKSQARLVTFEGLATEYLSIKAREYKSAKQYQKLNSQLCKYAFPHIGKLLLCDIERIHIENMLSDIWEVKTETANRVRLHVEKILDLARVKNLQSGENISGRNW